MVFCMVTKILPKEIYDWTQIDKSDYFWTGLDLGKSDVNFGIHNYQGELWTSGYVGVGRIFDKNMESIKTSGKEHVVIIKSQYGINPWLMLEKVMTDSEYNIYEEELKLNNKELYKVFYNQPNIKLEQDQNNSGQLLCALSYINSCYYLCKKGIIKRMFYNEKNYNCKIRGKIDVKKNIRINTSRGRNDRFFCKYIDFSSDNIENRILKATLHKCNRLIKDKFNLNTEIIRRLNYCINVFKHVQNVTIKSSDFNNLSISGLYIYYKPVLQQAKYILEQKYYFYKAKDGSIVNKSVFTIPYMINMEAVFEFYTRIVIKEYLKDSNYYVDSYAKKIFLEKGIKSKSDTRKNIHLMSYCIPDIIIKERKTDKIVAVFDAKYKNHNRSVRSDSQQLLSYVLLTGADRCGFIFPGEKSYVKYMDSENYLQLQTPIINNLRYYELILGEQIDKNEINKIFN